jgi:predicted RNase H-like HicB family nuclease
MTRIMELTAVLLPASEGGFTAVNPETGVTTQGESIEEALANLREATELYLEEFPLESRGRPRSRPKSSGLRSPRVRRVRRVNGASVFPSTGRGSG